MKHHRNSDNDTLFRASAAIEALLVERNPRGMATLRAELPPGYLLRAAERIAQCPGPIAIVTGFPVGDRLETDGPAGAIVLYRLLERLGKAPELWLEEPGCSALFSGLKRRALEQGNLATGTRPSPALAIVIERPGTARDGRFYNIRGNDISDFCHNVEPLLARLGCPIIAIGDGGNELGMGVLGAALDTLPIHPAVAGCDELIVADVSNWGAYALAMLLEHIHGLPPVTPDVSTLLETLVAAGAVDGVTGAPIATEDNFSPLAAIELLDAILRMLQQLPTTRPTDHNP